jgi:hypothetical protein
MTLNSRAPISRPAIAAVDLVPRAPVRLIGGEIEKATTGPCTRRFWEFYNTLPRDDGLPDRSSAGAETLRPWLGNLMILDPIDGGQDFQYRLYGSEIARFCGFDMTARLVSSFSSKTGSFFLDSYKTCLSGAEPVLTQNVAEHVSGMVMWERLLVPFRIRQNELQIVATNYPSSLVGKASLDRG